jgi:hypothetical protein
MTAAPRSPLSPDWREIASLGEQIVSASSLVANSANASSLASRAWWMERHTSGSTKIFSIAEHRRKPSFSEEPAHSGMQRAWKAGEIRTQKAGKKKGQRSRRSAWAAIPLRRPGDGDGGVAGHPPMGPEFKPTSSNLLEGLAGVVAVSLVAAHRVAVERFRLNQLNLVREVSAQIANVMNVDDLASRVTELIQQTFHYYYVAIFTLRRHSTSLRFRASAMPKVRARRRVPQRQTQDEGRPECGDRSGVDRAGRG